MFVFLNPEGKKVRVKKLMDLVKMSGMSYMSARSLNCGIRKALLGWCSTHPKAKKRREKFMTRLINTETGERSVVGQHPKRFAIKHNLCANTLNQLLRGERLCYKNWMLEKSYLRLTENKI